jgi:hypothetical protein
VEESLARRRRDVGLLYLAPRVVAATRALLTKAGLYKFANPVLTHSLKPPGSIP